MRPRVELWVAFGCLGCTPTASELVLGVQREAVRVADAAAPTAPDAAGPAPSGLSSQKEARATRPSSDPACRSVFYRDQDGDGFGDAQASVFACAQPAGHVARAGDCYDANEQAHPGVSGQFVRHRGDGSFDYDCDGLETPARTKFASCPKLDGACPPEAAGCNDEALRASWDAAEQAGWTDLRVVPCTNGRCPADPGRVPACGQAGSWGLSVAWDLLSGKYACTLPAAGTMRIQTCR